MAAQASHPHRTAPKKEELFFPLMSPFSCKEYLSKGPSNFPLYLFILFIYFLKLKYS